MIVQRAMISIEDGQNLEPKGINNKHCAKLTRSVMQSA